MDCAEELLGVRCGAFTAAKRRKRIAAADLLMALRCGPAMRCGVLMMRGGVCGRGARRVP